MKGGEGRAAQQAPTSRHDVAFIGWRCYAPGMNHFECPHIEGDMEAQRRRFDAARRLRESAVAKVRARRWEDLTPEEHACIASILHDVSPDA